MAFTIHLFSHFLKCFLNLVKIGKTAVRFVIGVVQSVKLIKIFFNRKGIPLNKLNTSGESISTIQKLIFDIDNEISSKKAEYATMVKIHLVNILIEMIRSYDGKLDELDISSNSQALRSIENAINYIDSNLESDITLDALSDAAHMSKTYFCSFA